MRFNCLSILRYICFTSSTNLFTLNKMYQIWNAKVDGFPVSLFRFPLFSSISLHDFWCVRFSFLLSFECHQTRSPKRLLIVSVYLVLTSSIASKYDQWAFAVGILFLVSVEMLTHNWYWMVSIDVTNVVQLVNNTRKVPLLNRIDSLIFL